MEEMAVITVDGVRSTIHSFLEKITAEQWRLLKSGTPDDATMFLLAEMIMEFIISITNRIMEKLRSTDAGICKEKVLNSLRETLHLSFARALEFPVGGRSVSSETLTKLMAKEVTDSVNSALSASTDPEKRVKVGGSRVTPSRRLNTMVGHASAMLRDFMSRVKSLCAPQPRRPRSNRSTEVESTDEEGMVLPRESLDREDAGIEDMEDSDGEMEDQVERPDTGDRLESPVKTGRQDTPEKIASEDSYLAQTSKAVQEFIRKELQELTEPLLYTVEDSEYELLQSESSFEIEVIGDDISRTLIEEAESLQHSASESPREESENGLKSKIKTVFAKLFVKSLIHRMLAQLKSKYHKIVKGESTHSVQSFMSSVESLLLVEDNITEGGNEVSVFRRLEIISSGKHLVFTKELSDLIYSHITDGMIVPESVRKKSIRETIKQQYNAMYNDVGNRVKCFLSLMNWWLKMQVGSHSSRVVLALMNTELFSRKQLPGVTAEEDATRSEERHARSEEDAALKKRKYKIAVSMLVEKLVCRLLTKAKTTIRNAEALTDHIFEKTWAEVETLDFRVTAKSIKNIDKAIFKDLCKVWENADMVLISMKSEDPLIENYIATSFKHHLTPKKRSTIHRFFSCVGKVLSEPFRRIFVK